NQAIHIEDDRVTFDLAGGHTYTTTALTGDEIGDVAGSTGFFQIQNGTVNLGISNDLSIGVNGNCNGVATITTGGNLIGPPVLNVGKSGNGTMIINSSGRVAADTVVIGNGAT